MATPPATPYLATVPPPGWDDFVASNGRYFCATSRWAEVVRAGIGGEVLFGALLGTDGEILVGILGSQRRTVGFKIFHSFFPYGGLIGDVGWGKALFDELMPSLKKRGYHLVVVEDRVRVLPSGLDVRMTTGVRHVRDLTGHRTEDDLFAGYKQKSARKNVTRALAKGLMVTEAATEDDIDSIYALYHQAMARNDAPTWYPKALFLEVFRQLVTTGDAKYLMVRHEGEVMGMMALVYSSNGTHYWMGGSSPAGLKNRVNDLLFHTALLGCLERGDEFFDAMGTGVNDTNLATFKEKWGTVPQEVLGYQIALAPIRARLFRIVYRLARGGVGASLIRRLRR